jgi:hypothetical protein
VSWTTPLTWVTGQVVTASQLNAQIRDNMSFLFDPPAAQLSAVSATIANSTTPVGVGSMSNVVFDSTGGAMTGTANKITATVAGLYDLNGSAVWASLATGAVRRLGFLVTGNVFGVSLVENSNNITVEQTTTLLQKLAANDTVQLAAAQSSGAGLLLNTPILAVSWVGAG